MTTQPAHISYSQLKLYETCPRKFWHTYVKEGGLRSLPNDLMSEGSQAHQAIATYIDERIAGRQPETCPIPAWQETIDSLINQPESRALTEVVLTIPTPYRPIKCVLDFAVITGNRATIIDWKLNRLPAYEDDEQLALYAAAIMAEHPEVLEVKGMYAVINSDKKVYHTHLFDQERCADTFRHWRRLSEQASKRPLERSSYELNPGDRCKSCPFAVDCAGKDYAFENYSLLSNEDLIRSYYVHSGVADQLKEEVRTRMERDNQNAIYAGLDGFTYKASMTLRESKMKPNKEPKGKK
mgnify:CR=1 FL=1